MKSCGVTIQKKATEQYFLVLLFMMMSQGGSYLLSLWMKSCSVTIHYLSQQYSSTALIVLFFFFFRFDVWYVMPWGGKWVSRFLFFFSLLTTKPAPTSLSYNVLLCVITKNIGSNTVELITDFFPCCSDNDLHRSSLEMIGNALNFLVNSWEIISVWISSPGQSGWRLALDDAS